MRWLGWEAEPGRGMMSPEARGARHGTLVATQDPGGGAHWPLRYPGQEGCAGSEVGLKVVF